MPTLPRERPQHMFRLGRPEDQVFEPAELLFYRYQNCHLIDGHISNLAVSFEHGPPSVNRQKYSQPEDVLFSEVGRYDGFGVVEFAVSDIPPEVRGEDGRAYVFFAKHVPLEDNYAHSEIHSDSLPRTDTYVKPSPTARKRFRSMLGQRFRIRIPASK